MGTMRQQPCLATLAPRRSLPYRPRLGSSSPSSSGSGRRSNTGLGCVLAHACVHWLSPGSADAYLRSASRGCFHAGT